MFATRRVTVISSVCISSGIGVILVQKKREADCGGEPKTPNSAFVFIKPHANTKQAQALVAAGLKARGVNIISHGELTAEQIDAGMLIDQHYYAIGKNTFF
jgi:hypothetical protein